MRGLKNRIAENKKTYISLFSSAGNKRDGVYYCNRRDTVLIAIIEPRFLLQ